MYERKLEQSRRARHNPSRRAKNVLNDSRFYDKRHDLVFDLDLAFVEEALEKGCSYCGRKDGVRIGLDRIDHMQGHTKKNVVPACTRCNFIRREMPYDAWLMIVPAIKRASDRGLFKDWEGGIGIHRRKE